MKINWKVRIKNPLWWARRRGRWCCRYSAYFGLAWEDMTSWGALWDVFPRGAESRCAACCCGQRV